MTSKPEELRNRRLLGRIHGASAPIVWLRGMAGAGKSRLLRTLIDATPPSESRLVFDLDAPSASDAAEVARAAREGIAAGRSVLIASRPSSHIERILLREAAYGRTQTLSDTELFFTPHEIMTLGADEGCRLFAETGGWPLLVAAALERRAEEMRRLLPDFLNAEALTSLPHAMVVALFAAAEAPFPLSAAIELFGSLDGLHPLLRATDEGVELRGAWCGEAIQALKNRPNLWRRATADALVRVYARHGQPQRAILALNALGQSRMACSVYEEAGGAFLAVRQSATTWKGLIDSFPAGLDERTESLILARVWEALATGRPAIALSRLEAHYPDLRVDLRAMRYAHRPNLILFRLMIEADFWSGATREVVESWDQLEALLDPIDPTGRALMILATADALAALGDAASAGRRLRGWMTAYPDVAPQLANAMRLRLAWCSITLGELDAAEQQLALAGPGDELQVAITALLAYERGGEPDRSWDLAASMELAWPALSFDLMRASVCLRLRRDGLAAALEQLSDAAAHLRRRHCGIDERAVQRLKIRLHQMARRNAEAEALLAGLGLAQAADPSAPAESLVRLRALAAERRPDKAVAERAASAVEAMDLSRRDRITLSLLRAQLHHRASETVEARRQAAAAIRLAAAERHFAPLIEDAELAEPLLGQLQANRGAYPETLIEVVEHLLKAIRTAPASASQAKETAGLSRQEHRVLDQLCDGKSNKQIARALDITDSTVKFHLRSLFAKFQVTGRKALVDAARRRGVVR